MDKKKMFHGVAINLYEKRYCVVNYLKQIGGFNIAR
jgi:hypothetical protein